MGMTRQEMIDNAWRRMLEAQLTVHPAGEDDFGIVHVFVKSQREGHQDHEVIMLPDGPHCDCEAMYYGRVPVCIHILTVAWRALRAKKRGSAGVARLILGIYGLPEPLRQPLTMR